MVERMEPVGIREAIAVWEPSFDQQPDDAALPPVAEPAREQVALSPELLAGAAYAQRVLVSAVVLTALIVFVIAVLVFGS